MNKHLNEKALKDKKVRYSEYYGMTELFDNLHKRAKNKERFQHLMTYIVSEENILLAYRNIKRNKGSNTASTDRVTIKDIENMSQNHFIETVRTCLVNYNPSPVKRKFIPKQNGKTRPLGIPSFWDRIIQQCILQVIEPICEAHFCTRSYGFRPNRSAENAIASAVFKINKQNLTYVVDIDIKGFFDEVNHTKLMRQLWTLGIQDKQLLVVLRKILKSPLVLETGETVFPTKGTPQGGILSPLLSNVNLNEFDWWIHRQWESFPIKEILKSTGKNGCQNRSHENEKLKKTKLKPMYIVRYADDFKIFTNNKTNANKIYYAVEKWLAKRLKLPISEEKSSITNLKKRESDFLGFTLKAIKKGKKHKKTGQIKYVAETHMSSKAVKMQKAKLAQQIKVIQKSSNPKIVYKNIGKYNSMVIGAHNYYCIATHISRDIHWVGKMLTRKLYHKLSKAKKRNSNGFTRIGKYDGQDKGIIPYLNCKAIRYYRKQPILPFAYCLHKSPMMKQVAINKYTPNGRKLIHRNLDSITKSELAWLRDHPITSDRATLELNDNRLSLYVAQKGKCGVTNEKLELTDMHCHHKQLWSQTKDDSYNNLILVKSVIHRLIHIVDKELARKINRNLNLSDEQLIKINKLRLMVGNVPFSLDKMNKFYCEQLTLF